MPTNAPTVAPTNAPTVAPSPSPLPTPNSGEQPGNSANFTITGRTGSNVSQSALVFQTGFGFATRRPLGFGTLSASLGANDNRGISIFIDASADPVESDIFPINGTGDTVTVGYDEPNSRAWQANNTNSQGFIKIDKIQGNQITMTVNDARLSPTSNNNGGASGSFTLNGRFNVRLNS